MFGSMKGKSIVVTGGGKGIGMGIARVFAAQGGQLFIIDKSGQAVSDAVVEIKRGGGEVAGYSCDVADPEAMRLAADECVKTFGGIDVLCSNAGIFPQVSLESMTVADWDKVMNTNLKGTFVAVQACLPALKKSGKGRIVITSSITGPVTGFPGWSHYGASKAGQLGFLRTAALELARYGITINAVLPGNVATEGLADQGEKYITTMKASIPLHELGTPADIGWAALFFATPEAGFITGQALVVDGGQILPETLEAIL